MPQLMMQGLTRFRRFLFVFLLIAGIHQPLRAQYMDTLRACIKRGAKLSFSLDGRNSFISNRKAPIWGVKLGATFGNRLTVGGGLNIHRPQLTKTVYYDNDAGHRDSAEGELNLRYLSYFVKYIYFKDAHWEYSVMPLQIGFGDSYYSYLHGTERLKEGRRMIMTYEGGLSVSYMPVRWVGLGMDLGMRLMIRNNKAIPENFNSPYYSFSLIIDWIAIYKSLFPETKLAKKL